MAESGKTGCVNASDEQEIRKQLHDISNVLTVLVGRVEILSKSSDLSEKHKKEIRGIFDQGLACFEILERAKEIMRKSTL